MSERESKRLSAVLESMGRYLPGMAAETAFIACRMFVALAGAAVAMAVW